MKSYSSEVKEKAISLIKNGASINEVSKKLKIGASTIHYWIKSKVNKDPKVKFKKVKLTTPDSSISIFPAVNIDKKMERELALFKQENAALKNLLRIYFEEN